MTDQFRTTQWSLVLSAAKGGAGSPQALEALCRTYWYPLYAYVRRQGNDADAARDLTQSFFASLLARDGLTKIDPRLGKFRAFLLASMKNFLANERERDGALKRRLNDPAFRVDGETAERIYAGERATSLGADELFEAKWARTVLEGALKRLAEENSGTGKRETFRRLRGCLTGDEPPYEQLANDLATTEGAVRVAVHRLRRRLGAILRELVAQTVEDPADVDAELRSLLQAAGRAS